MLITVEGIVIKQRIIGEANCFLDILTGELGLIEVTAHGIKKLTSKNAGSTSLFSYATFCLNKNGTRYTLNSSEPKYKFHKLSQNLEALSLAVYFADILRYCSASEQKEENILRFFAMTLYKLENKNCSLPLVKAVFEFRLMCKIGFLPDLRACQECITYESDEMYFLPSEGLIYCGDCLAEKEQLLASKRFALSPTLLYTMRYVAYSDIKKMYSFKLSDVATVQFGEVSEYYLLEHLNKSFRSLEYYKNLLL